MKLKLLNPLAATAAALAVLIVGLAAYEPSRAGILDFLQHKTEATAQADAPKPDEPTANPAPVLAPTQVAALRSIQTEQLASQRALQLIEANLPPNNERGLLSGLRLLLQ